MHKRKAAKAAAKAAEEERRLKDVAGNAPVPEVSKERFIKVNLNSMSSLFRRDGEKIPKGLLVWIG